MIKTVYHASPYVYDFPVYEKLLKGVSKGGHHKNGQLGLWCAMKNDWIHGFGKNIYEVSYDDSSEKIMCSKAFSKLCNNSKQEPDYQEWRKELIDSGYSVLALKELNGSIDMLIILDFNIIKNFCNIS